jgi:hypothetical protein
MFHLLSNNIYLIELFFETLRFMTHVNDLHLLVMQDKLFSNSSIIVFFLNLIFSIDYCLYRTTIICILQFFYFMYS